MEPGSTHDASPHVSDYVLHRGGQAVARLEWRGRWRAGASWYLRRRARPARRLAVDVGLDAFAGDPLEDRLGWKQSAQAAAALSLPLALDEADRALRGGVPAAPSRPLEPGVYELHVIGMDASTLALACPSLRVTRAGDTSVIGGVLDDDAMRMLIRRVNLLGARVLAIFREVPRRAHHHLTSAADRPGD
jgi:hypothetical protein